MLMTLPEGRGLVGAALRNRAPWVILAFVYPMALVVFWAGNYGAFSMQPNLVEIVRCVIIGIWIRHAVGQIHGLSILYDRAESPGAAPTDLMTREHSMFKIFSRISLFSPFLASENYPFLQAFMPSYLILVAWLTVFILWGTWRQASHKFSHKFWYQTRLFFVVAAVLSPLAFKCVAAFHGIEYLLISYKMVKNSKWNVNIWKWAGLLLVALIAYPIARLSIEIYPGRQTLFILLLYGLSHALDYTHYYLDAVVFRFQDPNVRHWVGPLLRATPRQL